MNTKKLLFITWDGPQTFYMEGLFMPIFQEIKRQNPEWEFHVIQFTWGDEERISITQEKAKELGTHYQTFPISRKPVASVGSFISLFLGAPKIKKYIQHHQIDVVMPRSTFPAFMVNKLMKNGKDSFKEFKGKDIRVIFDADGLPIEERVDFAGLKRNSFMYRFLKRIETKMLLNADHVITRSQKAIDIHLGVVKGSRTRFSVVKNGRDIHLFNFQEDLRNEYRKKLGLTFEFLFVYAGSLGPQYCWEEMLQIFRNYRAGKSQQAKFLVLTGDLAFAESKIPADLKEFIFLKKVNSEEVPAYLNAADLGFALRQPKFSMQGVAPIKLGEYLLCGLPVIASKGIGDSAEILENFEHTFLVDHQGEFPYEAIQKFLESLTFVNRMEIFQKAIPYFSLEAAAKTYINVLKIK
jgi:glycosyltransferase involved in cell wall biosynthesis